jgi:hypothetical protein
MKIGSTIGVLALTAMFASPLGHATTSAGCPTTSVPSADECITVVNCLDTPVIHTPYTCAYKYCDGITWTSGTPGKKFKSHTTGTVTCTTRQGYVDQHGNCVGPNPNGTVLHTTTTTGVTSITTGNPC